MAKEKNKPIEPEIIEEITEEPILDEPKVDSNDFINRTLYAINKMQNPAKAERLAHRLLRKKARKH